MKNIFLSIAFIALVSSTFAQQDTTWKKGGGAVLNFNQTGLKNWAAGGESSLAASMLANFFSNYKSGKDTWDNTLNLNYGLITANNYQVIRKNDDKIELNSKYGRYAFDKFYYSALLNFLTQFAPGYDYVSDPGSNTPISKFLAPGYLTAAIGMDWKPNSRFSLFLSPATGKLTIVNDPDIANRGTYGNIAADTVGGVITAGKKTRGEFGASVIATLNTELAKNVNLSSKLTLFNNYTDQHKANRKNIDADFVNTLNLKVNKYLGASVYFEALYDQDVLVPLFDSNDVLIGTGPRLQIKEVFGLGISVTF